MRQVNCEWCKFGASHRFQWTTAPDRHRSTLPAWSLQKGQKTAQTSHAPGMLCRQLLWQLYGKRCFSSKCFYASNNISIFDFSRFFLRISSGTFNHAFSNCIQNLFRAANGHLDRHDMTWSDVCTKNEYRMVSLKSENHRNQLVIFCSYAGSWRFPKQSIAGCLEVHKLHQLESKKW